MFHPLDPQRLAHEERLRETYNRWARDALGASLKRQSERLLGTLARRMQLTPEERILDVGCGDGWASAYLAERCPEGAVVGIDLSDEMIDRARDRAATTGNQLFQGASVEEIPWAEDYFTRVVSIESAYHWYSPERAVREIYRVTSYGGRVFLLMSYYSDHQHTAHWQQLFDTPLQSKSARDWKDLFGLLGFQDVEAAIILDRAPLPWLFRGDELWPSKESRREFQQQGVLLVTAAKPAIPAAGPIEPWEDPLPVLS